jgi:hypothetical protein
MNNESKINLFAVSAREWLWVVLIWSCFALFDASQTTFVMLSQHMHHDWLRVALFRYLVWMIWLLATPMIMRLVQRYPPQRCWPLHLLVCTAIGLLTASWDAGLELLLDPWNQNSSETTYSNLWFGQFLGSMLSDLVIYITIVAIAYGLESRERLLRKEAETAHLNTRLAHAQLDALRRQIEPHFLFNTLNTVTGLVRENKNNAAVGVIVGMSDLLRRVLDDSDRHLVPLSEELRFLEKYVEIQKIRFGDRLSVSIDVADELHQLEVPSMILQPLVENAFKHGLEHRAQSGVVRLRAARVADRLILSIYNDGPPLADGIVEGIGHINTRERLKGHYGERFSLTMRNRDIGVEVQMSIPLGGK